MINVAGCFQPPDRNLLPFHRFRCGSEPLCHEFPWCKRGQWRMGEGVFNVTTFFEQLTSRPGALRLKRRAGSFMRLRYRLLPCGLSDQVRKSLPFYKVPNNFVVALKTPSPMRHLQIIWRSAQLRYCHGTLFIDGPRPVPATVWLPPLPRPSRLIGGGPLPAYADR